MHRDASAEFGLTVRSTAEFSNGAAVRCPMIGMFWDGCRMCLRVPRRLYIVCAVLALGMAAPTRANDDNTYGCEVVLCLATPGSPLTYAECVPPIEKFFASLLTGGGMPTCAGSGITMTPAGGNFGNQLFSVSAPGQAQPTWYYLYKDSNNQVQVVQLSADQVQQLQAWAQMQAADL